MLKNFLTLASLAGLLSIGSVAYSQAKPTATARGGLQAGVGWTWTKPDYGPGYIQGATFFTDLDVTPHIGAEAEYHYISLETPTDLGENSFFVGPRVVFPHGRFSPYAKGLVGFGDLVIQGVYGTLFGGDGRYFAYAYGGGLDYRATRHLVVRGDYEYQHWDYRHGLTPVSLTVAFAYRFR